MDLEPTSRKCQFGDALREVVEVFNGRTDGGEHSVGTGTSMSVPSDDGWFGDLAAGTGAAEPLPRGLRDVLMVATRDAATEAADLAQLLRLVPDHVAATGLRLDGLYVNRSTSSGNSGYVRFYPDGTVKWLYSTDEVERVASSFSGYWVGGRTGFYAVRGTGIELVRDHGGDSLEYSGRIVSPTELLLDWHSFIGRRLLQVGLRFEFVKVRFENGR